MRGENKNVRIGTVIEEQVRQNHEEILKREQVERSIIDVKSEQFSSIIENENLRFKEELDEKKKSKEKMFKEIEIELEKAMEEGNMDGIEKSTKRLESLMVK